MKSQIQYSDKIRVICNTIVNEQGEDIINKYIVQKWYGWSWPFGIWLTNTNIGDCETEEQANAKCRSVYGLAPVVDDVDYLNM